MQGFLKKISPPIFFLFAAFLAVILEHTIFGPIALERQAPNLVLLFLCLSLFFTVVPFWFWCFRIFTAGFLIEMTGGALPGFKLMLIFFCGMVSRYFLTLINYKGIVPFICFFSTFFLIVEGAPLAIYFLLERAAPLSFYALGARLIYSILLAIPLFYFYERFRV